MAAEIETVPEQLNNLIRRLSWEVESYRRVQVMLQRHWPTWQEDNSHPFDSMGSHHVIIERALEEAVKFKVSEPNEG